MSDVVIRPTGTQTMYWLIAAGGWAGLAVFDTVLSALVFDRMMGLEEELGVDLRFVALDVLIVLALLWAFWADRRRGVAMGAEGVRVKGWFGTRTLAYEEISHVEVRRKLGMDRVTLRLAGGRGVLLGAPQRGPLLSDARFAEKVAAVENELARHTRQTGTFPPGPDHTAV